MSEELTQETSEKAQETVETPAREETDWKAEARKWEERSKENFDALNSLKNSNESLKNEYAALKDKAEKWEAELNAITAERQINQMISDVAASKNVPAELLRGTTHEELESHADLLASHIASRPVMTSVPTQGASPQNTVGDDLSLVRSLFGKVQ